MSTSVAYFHGEDAWAIDEAVARFAREAGSPDEPLEIWRANPDEDAADGGAGSAAVTGTAAKRRARLLDEIGSRLGTAPLFGGGTLVVVRQPASLLRETVARQRLLAIVAAVPPGNALCFSDLAGTDGKTSAASEELRRAVKDAGGSLAEFPALTRERMQSWLERRAADLGATLGPGAARLLAERVGAFVREGDIDRRRQSSLANAELEKLVLYRLDGNITRDDVAELVPEAIPGSMWAFLDAVALRRGAEASRLAERLLGGGTPLPVLVGQLHRRVRELIIVREHLETGTRPADLVRVMRLQPFRAQKLTEQAETWDLPNLEAAVSGLLELDLRSKGITLDGSTAPMTDARDALGVQLWITEHAGR
jgi:DNA polymerase III delta subunit